MEMYCIIYEDSEDAESSSRLYKFDGNLAKLCKLILEEETTAYILECSRREKVMLFRIAKKLRSFYYAATKLHLRMLEIYPDFTDLVEIPRYKIFGDSIEFEVNSILAEKPKLIIYDDDEKVADFVLVKDYALWIDKDLDLFRLERLRKFSSLEDIISFFR